VKAALERLREELGMPELASLALLAVAIAFSLAVVKPLEARRAQLEQELENALRRPQLDGMTRVSAGAPGARLDAFYRFFERPEHADEWLAKLYGIATAQGIALRSADYRLGDTRQRLERYQITLPVSGSYTQIRAFLETALAEVPVLSLDQISFRRKATGETRVEADIVLTLHLPRR